MKTELSLFADVRAKLGEGPVWIEDKLWYVDILSEEVGCLPVNADGTAGEDRRFPAGSPVGALVPRKKGGLVLAIQNGFAAMDTATGAVSPFPNPPNPDPTIRFNDGKCDPRGRFIAGTMSLKGEKEVGDVFALDPDLSTRKLFGGVTTSNGLAWTDDGGTFYYTDTPTHEIVAYSYDLDSGTVSDRRVVVTVPDGMGHPDGMTIDRDGNLWVALWGGWAVACWDPRTGKLLGKIEVPAENVTCPTFGGPDYDRLFITTARLQRTDEEAKNQPHAGGIFVCEPGPKGHPPFAFAG